MLATAVVVVIGEGGGEGSLLGGAHLPLQRVLFGRLNVRLPMESVDSNNVWVVYFCLVYCGRGKDDRVQLCW